MPGAAYVTAETLADRTRCWLASCQLPPARTRELPPLARAALLVVDLQRYFADPDSHAYLPALEAVVPNIQRLLRAFRGARRPVILTRHGGRPAAETAAPSAMRRWWRDELLRDEPRAALIDAVEPQLADLVIDKQRYSAFCETDLQQQLHRLGCDTVVGAGVMTHLCCETSARDAFMRDLQVVVVADGCASVTEELHLGALRGLAHGFAVVSAADEIAASLKARTGSTRPTGDLRQDAIDHSGCDVAVVGSGPAGLAAAVQARRSGLSVAVIERGPQPGGLVRTANLVENYPGFPGGIAGDDLARRFVAQTASLAVPTLLQAEVTSIRSGVDGLELEIARARGRTTLRARAVIVATGSAPRPLPALAHLLDAGAVVHRLDELETVRGRRLLVVGGGEAALDQALLARRLGAAEVTVAIRASAPRALELLVVRAQCQGIDLRPGVAIRGAARQPDGSIVVDLERGVTAETEALDRAAAARWPRSITVDAIAVCVGRAPCLPRLPPEIDRLDDGSPRLDVLGRSSVVGLYLVGDVRRGSYRQVGIAVGDGLAAAMHAARHLRSPERSW